MKLNTNGTINNCNIVQAIPVNASTPLTISSAITSNAAYVQNLSWNAASCNAQYVAINYPILSVSDPVTYNCADVTPNSTTTGTTGLVTTGSTTQTPTTSSSGATQASATTSSSTQVPITTDTTANAEVTTSSTSVVSSASRTNPWTCSFFSGANRALRWLSSTLESSSESASATLQHQRVFKVT